MPLLTNNLAGDLKYDLDMVSKTEKKTAFDAHIELGKRWAMSIEKYITKADVLGTHTITNLQILPGADTLEFQTTTPTIVPGKTYTPGMPAVGSTTGPFGKGAYGGATGKIK